MFCQNCGNQLKSNANFCSKCGFKVQRRETTNLQQEVRPSTSQPQPQAPQPQYQAPPQNAQPAPSPQQYQQAPPQYQQAQQSVGPKPMMVLQGSMTVGMFKSKIVYLVFYNDRMVVAEFTKQRQDEEIKAAIAKSKSEGKGFFKTSGAMLSSFTNYGNRFYQMTPAEAMNDETTNFEIPHGQISKFVFVRVDTVNYNDNTQNTTGGKIEIQHAGDKIKIGHSYTDGNKNIRGVLENLYGDRLKYKGKLLKFTITNRQGFI